VSHVDFDKNEPLPLLQGKFLGYGVHGGVYETHVNGKAVAWKKKYCRTKISVQAQREISIIKRLNHQHIIKLVGTYTHGPFLGLLLWPVAICDLATFLSDVDGLNQLQQLGAGTLEFEEATVERFTALGIDGTGSLEIARIAAVRRLKQSLGCITSAIVYLHGNHIKHKDLKPSNVLLGREDLYITDFGTSTHFDNTISLSQDGDRGTPKYFSPEVAHFQPSGRSADIFSLGCIFFEIASLCNGRSLDDLKLLRPDDDNSFHANLSHIHRFFDYDDKGVLDLSDQHLFGKIRLMLRENPQERPTAAEIEHYLILVNVLGDESTAIPLWGACCSPAPTPLSDLPPSIGTVNLTIGNTHEARGERQHSWSFYIHCTEEEIIEKVLVFLVRLSYIHIHYYLEYDSCFENSRF
jgi:serine/threonine protein kinase